MWAKMKGTASISKKEVALVSGCGHSEAIQQTLFLASSILYISVRVPIINRMFSHSSLSAKWWFIPQTVTS